MFHVKQWLAPAKRASQSWAVASHAHSLRTTLLEESADDLFYGDVLDADIDDRE